jgi:general secretion pathway protein A
MYNDLFGLRKEPFRVTPDPSFLFLTDQHREALSGLTFGILQRSGFIVLTGEVGTGKTTLVARILRFLPASKLQYSKIVNPLLTPSEFLELALLEFGLTDIPLNKGQRLWMLKTLVLKGQREGKVSVLIVDEAHLLSPELLEELRMLGNFEEDERPFLQILLIGQREFDETLNRSALRPLKQRIGVRFTLEPLAPAEVAEYMRHRWLTAGGGDLPFTPEAIEDVVLASRRIPRVINALCDHALFAAYREASPRVLDRHVRVAAANLDLGELPRREEIVEPEAPVLTTIPETRASLWDRWTQTRKRMMS